MNAEREQIRQEQSQAVMPLIGPLLDAWDATPNDVKYDRRPCAPTDDPELARVAAKIGSINNAIDPMGDDKI